MYLRAMFYSKNRLKYSVLSLLTASMAAGIMGCASMGSPGGGLYDEDPPELRTVDPADGSTNFNKQKITLRFNENVKLDKVIDKMTISPPQKKMPVVMSNAKTVTIELLDTLKENTTYSIDLADAVQDNNEGNPMESLSLLFTTGDHIDSLQISGHLLNAEDLEPITGAYVGIFKMKDAEGNPCMYDSVTAESLGDSIFVKYPFERAGKTDALGAFKIMGCAPGAYKVYALIDGNTNYVYDMLTEDIAFLDSLVIPSMRPSERPDTTWIDSMTIDTIKMVPCIDYQPSDLLLRSFNEGRVTRYLDDCSRPDSLHIAIRMAAWMPERPEITFLLEDSANIAGDSVLVCEGNLTNDTLSYWIRDSLLYCQDTLQFTLSYLFTDSLSLDVVRTDTMQLVKPAVKATANDKDSKKEDKRGKRRKKGDGGTETDSIAAPEIIYMTLRQNSGNNLDIGKKPRFEVSAPLAEVDLSKLHLERQKDSLWIDMKFQWVADTLNPRLFTLVADPHFSPGETYRLTADSAAMSDIYGHPLAETKLTFKEKTQEEYAHLLFNVSGVTGPAFVQLLDSKDKPVQQAKVVDSKAKFVHVPAGTYFARLVVDLNENGKFDRGNLWSRTQPEEVFYFGGQLQLRANWSMDQSWNVRETPLLQQKPKEVKINKPKEEKAKKSKNEEYLRKLGKL